MTGWARAALVAGAVTLVGMGGASAADDLGWPVGGGEDTHYEIGSNWYLRGDIGYAINSKPEAHFDEPGYGALIDETLQNTGTIGVGFGFELNDTIRFDLTLDYAWPAEFEGQLICPAVCPGPGPDPEFSVQRADIRAVTMLVNGYYDFAPVFFGLKPYLGAGVGLAYVTTDNVRFVEPTGASGTRNGGESWNFAWALMAGVSYELDYNLWLDAGYRFLHLGDAETAAIPVGSGSNRIEFDNISEHEFRLGVRYMIY